MEAILAVSAGALVAILGYVAVGVVNVWRESKLVTREGNTRDHELRERFLEIVARHLEGLDELPADPLREVKLADLDRRFSAVNKRCNELEDENKRLERELVEHIARNEELLRELSGGGA